MRNPTSQPLRQQQPRRVLQLAQDDVAEDRADGPVHDAVVEREGEVDQVRGADRAGVVVDGPTNDFADPQYPNFRVVDDRGGDEPAEVADGGDGEDASLEVVELRLAGP